MVSGCVPRLLLLLLLASSPPALLADDCHPTTVSSVRLSASSYRNLTGHWFTKAVLIRKSTSDVSKLQTEERSLHYDVDITRQGCGDDEILTTVFSVIAPPARVGADYKFFPGIGYYKLHTEKLNWENARRSCAKEGAHLAIVNSEAEENAIREVMRSYSKENFPAFIGFHDMFKEGEFVTIFGEPLISTGHVRWAKGEPNNRKLEGSPEDEDCGDINPDGTINDNMCSKEMLFVYVSMVSARIPRLLLVLFLAASPTALLADDCLSSSVSSVRLSASSYRNMTGHWITKAVLTRKSTRDVSNLQREERPMHYDVDITRQGCGDDETLTTEFSVIAPPARVGADYKFFPGIGYYKLHTEKVNWENARRSCAKEGAHLAIVNSEAEENAIREVMRSYSKENFPAFIGFHDMVKEGEYVTIFGDPLNSTGHVRWTKGEPTNAIFPGSPEGEDCGNIYGDGTINDARCNIQLAFVCEQGL